MKGPTIHARLVTLLLCNASLVLSQRDQPVADDLTDQHKTAQSKHEDQSTLIAQATGILSTRNLDSITKQSGYLQLQIKKCVNTGDFRRTEEGIYAKAAGEAGRQAQELEAKAANPTSKSASLSEAELARQLNQVEHSIAALSSQGNLSDIERAELDDLRTLQRQLVEALDILRMLPSGDRTRYVLAAQRMRQKENLFLTKSRGSKALAAASNEQCRGYRIALGGLFEQVQAEKLCLEWEALSGQACAASLGTPTSAQPPPARDREVERLKDEAKKSEQILSDPEALQKRIDYLKSLSSQPGSN